MRNMSKILLWLGIILILIIGLMLGSNAIFTAFEMALASVSQARLLVLKNQKRAGAASALYLKERLGASLAVAQVGITLAAALAAATGGAGVQESIAPRLRDLWQLSHHEAQALAGQAVQMRRLNIRIPGKAEGLCPPLVG